MTKSYVVIEIAGAAKERFLTICKNHSIKLWDISYHNRNIIASISISDYKKISKIRSITKVHIKVIGKKGIRFWTHSNKWRYYFIVGFAILIASVIYVRSHLHSINVEGCVFYDENEIVNQVNQIGIHKGMPLKAIDCSNIELVLRQSKNNLAWVSANINGNELNINIKEAFYSKDAMPNELSDIVASKDGRIVRIVTRSGTPIVKAGDVIKAGDILVSSEVNAINEYKETIYSMNVYADADIEMESKVVFHEECNDKISEKIYTGRTEENMALRVHNNIFNYKTESKFELYDSFRIIDNSSLPLVYLKIINKEYQIQDRKLSYDEQKEILEEKLNNYIEKLQENSTQIVSKSVKIDKYSGKVCIDAEIVFRYIENTHVRKE